MSAHTGFGPRDRWRLRQNRLWILAALLAAATLYSSVGIVHDTSQRRVAARLVRKAAAERIVAYAASRLTASTLEMFAGASLADGASQVPADERFRIDLSSGALDRRGARATPDSVLIRIARADATRDAERPLVHLTTGRMVGESAVVTYVQFDTAGRPRTVFGFVAPARALGTWLFSDADRATTIVDMGERMVTLDSTSLAATGADSVPLFGRLELGGRLPIVLTPRGPLEGSSVALALGSWQFNKSLIQFVPQQQLWHNGMLTVATMIVVIFAVGSARRETLLARARSDFVAGVSHDLRMPLAQILLASETLVVHDDAPKRERQGMASTIVRESRRLIALVENLLLFSRTGSVELRPRIELVRIDELFASVVESVELAAEDVNQTIDVSSDVTVGVHADAQLLRQAMVNLVDNALKYGPSGQHVRLAAERSSATRVRLTVDDEGPGIPPDQRERVFQPYERLRRDQMSERTGTGLGLSVARQIVIACSGRVWIEDGPSGRGTRAVIELGAVELSSPAPAPAETM
jgi:signal transduction histidine kinase